MLHDQAWALLRRPTRRQRPAHRIRPPPIGHRGGQYSVFGGLLISAIYALLPSFLTSRTSLGPTTRTKHFLIAFARVGIAAGPGPTRASAVGHRTTLSAPQDRTRARSLRRAYASGLAAPCGHQCRSVRLSPERADARASDAALTFPALRAIVEEVFTGLLFASRPRYVTWLQTAQAKYQLWITKLVGRFIIFKGIMGGSGARRLKRESANTR